MKTLHDQFKALIKEAKKNKNPFRQSKWKGDDNVTIMVLNHDTGTLSVIDGMDAQDYNRAWGIATHIAKTYGFDMADRANSKFTLHDVGEETE